MSGMKSTHDSPRSRRKHGANHDRISDLPDPILGNILSFLPTNNAVATGILSKRWKSLWTLAANLDFRCPRDYTGSVEQFVQFVNYVLLFHKHGCFQRLSLTWKTGCLPFHVNTWIGVALDRDVSELYVCADISKLPNQLQSSLFSSESLKSLELDCNICIPSPETETVFNLPRLERLRLISVYFNSEKDIDKIVKGCPELKYLIIHMDVWKMVEHGYLIAGDFDDYDYENDEDEDEDEVMIDVDGNAIKYMISSASLTHLEISVNAFSTSPIPLKVAWGVGLDVPSLNYIKLDGFLLSISAEQGTLSFLDEANIEFNGSVFDDRFYCNSWVEAFSAFGCAKTLTLHDQVIRAFRYARVEMRSKFDRLTRLEVSIDCSYWSSLKDFIMLSDNLKVLIVHKHKGLETDDVPYYDNSKTKKKKVDLVPRCLSKSLQTVSIGGYYGHRDELAMIEYVLKQARVLEILEIGFADSITGGINRKLELVQEISAFRRKSELCEVRFS